MQEERGENFVVEYRQKVRCLDGKSRKTCWYQCKKDGGHAMAEQRAWRHVQQSLGDFGNSPHALADQRFGTGAIHKDADGLLYHGTKSEKRFRAHAAKPDFARNGIVRWDPEFDTFHKLDPPNNGFCRDCVRIERSPSGVVVWECKGHDPLDRSRSAELTETTHPTTSTPPVAKIHTASA